MIKTPISLLVMLVVLISIESCTPPGSNATAVAKTDTTYNFVEGHAPIWQGAIGQVLALVDSMPDDQLAIVQMTESEPLQNKLVILLDRQK